MSRIRAPIRRLFIAPAVLALALAGVLTVGITGSSPTANPNPAVADAPAMSLANCQCGGPGGAADLAHISPWANADCSTNIGLSNVSSVDVYIAHNGSLNVAYAGWVEWRYSSYRSCHGYQWLRFHLNMSVVRQSTVANGFSTMMWLSQDALDWTTYATNFTGGASDGVFDTIAIMAGPLTTTAGIWTSLAMFWDTGHSPPTNFTA